MTPETDPGDNGGAIDSIDSHEAAGGFAPLTLW
jgi:hypothetical protein